MSATANSLGFLNVPCGGSGCPSLPFKKVRLCLQVIQDSKFLVYYGCGSCSSESVATIRYNFPQTFTSMGAPCKSQIVDLELPANGFVRVDVCANGLDSCGGSGCGLGVVVDSEGAEVHNAITKFTIDGVDYSNRLQQILETETHSLGCVYVGCQNPDPADGDCCNFGTLTPFDSLLEIPYEARIEVGPVGQDIFAAPIV